MLLDPTIFPFIFHALALFISPSTTFQLDSRFTDTKPKYKSFHDSVYARDADDSKARNDTILTPVVLSKRGQFKLNNEISDGDKSYLQQAFIDMQELVTFVAANPNPAVTARYFDPNDQNDVTAIFDTVRRMAEAGGVPRPSGERYLNIRPYDLSELTILLAKSIQLKLLLDPGVFIEESLTLAFAENTNAEYREINHQIPEYPPTITVTEFGWGALWQRQRRSISCRRDIAGRTNFKMHFLGSLLLHEILHFNNIPQLAWGGSLAPDEYLDDQEGSCKKLKAYGPFEAIGLRQNKPDQAKLNIENYICPTETGYSCNVYANSYGLVAERMVLVFLKWRRYRQYLANAASLYDHDLSFDCFDSKNILYIS